MSQSWPIKLVLQVILPHNRDSADVSAKCLCVDVQGFIRGGGGGGFIQGRLSTPTLGISGGDIPLFFFLLIQKLNPN